MPLCCQSGAPPPPKPPHCRLPEPRLASTLGGVLVVSFIETGSGSAKLKRQVRHETSSAPTPSTSSPSVGKVEPLHRFPYSHCMSLRADVYRQKAAEAKQSANCSEKQ